MCLCRWVGPEVEAASGVGGGEVGFTRASDKPARVCVCVECSGPEMRCGCDLD